MSEDYGSFEMLVRILYIWDVPLRHWIIGYRRFVTAQRPPLQTVKMYVPQTVAQLVETLRLQAEWSRVRFPMVSLEFFYLCTCPGFFNSCRRVPETKCHFSLFLH